MKNPKNYIILFAPILCLGLYPLTGSALSKDFLISIANSSPVANNIIVTKYITPAIQFLSVGVGVVVLAMIIVGAIQYSASGGNPQTISAAKKKIFNAILALLVFALSFALLNFLIPGGLITT
jgi:hypothetical protein